MPERKNVMLSIKELIDEITSRDEVLVNRRLCKKQFSVKNEELLNMVMTKTFFEQLDREFQQKLTGRTLGDLMNAKGGKSSAVGERRILAQRIAQYLENADSVKMQPAWSLFDSILGAEQVHPGFQLKKISRVYDALVKKPIRPTEWIASNSKNEKKDELERIDKQLDQVR